jgi:hypothetical protein
VQTTTALLAASAWPLLCASANGRSESVKVYKAGIAETLEARCTAAILDALAAAGIDEDTNLPNWVKVSPLRRKYNWEKKFSTPVINRVLSAMRSPGGPVVAKYYKRLDNDGKEIDDYNRPNGTYRLKGADDAD